MLKAFDTNPWDKICVHGVCLFCLPKWILGLVWACNTCRHFKFSFRVSMFEVWGVGDNFRARQLLACKFKGCICICHINSGQAPKFSTIEPNFNIHICILTRIKSLQIKAVFYRQLEKQPFKLSYLM